MGYDPRKGAVGLSCCRFIFVRTSGVLRGPIRVDRFDCRDCGPSGFHSLWLSCSFTRHFNLCRYIMDLYHSALALDEILMDCAWASVSMVPGRAARTASIA